MAKPLAPEPICETCRVRAGVAVVSMPFVPASFSYCQTCLEANAHPYGMVVVNTALVGGYDRAVGEWQQLVDDTLDHLSISRQRFDADVAQEERDMERQLREE